MPKLNTYPAQNTFPDALTLMGVLPGVGEDFSTVRVTKTALLALLSSSVPEDGREVALQTTATHIQWQYVGDAGWTNLIALSELKGDKGDSGTGLTNKGNWAAATFSPGDYVFSTGSVNPTSMWVLNSLVDYVSTLAPASDTDHWIELAAPAGAAGTDGTDGEEVSLQVAAGYIQWRLGSGSWANLVSLASLKGDKGDIGDPGDPGLGVPAGGTTGQILSKTSGTDFATQWVAPPTGGSSPAGGTTGQYLAKTSASDGAVSWQGPALNLAGNQTISGEKTFTGQVSLPICVLPSTAIPASQEGGTYNVGAGVQTAYIRTTGGGALTIKMPNYAIHNTEIAIFVDGAASSLTWNAGAIGYGSISTKGGPTVSTGVVGTVWRLILDGVTNTYYWLCIGHTN